jgi:phenylpyruvate tautomerase PptA (4-oxalocrotonate tautomerase family)
MGQIKIYGIRQQLQPIRDRLSDILHGCVMEALQYPSDKRAHRFIYLEKDDFFYPAGRTDRYIILEISMFEGRSVEAKKRLINLIFERFSKELSLEPMDVELTIFETPRHNWGIRGLPGDELLLNYEVKI